MSGPSRSVDLGISGLEDAVLVGRGGFAVVYRAYQPAFRRTVAVKVVSAAELDELTAERFRRECQALGLLSEHPSIVTVFDAGFLGDGRPYLVMAYMPEGSLADRLARDGPVGWQEASRVGVKLAGALGTAHEAGVLHRDVKPLNVLVSAYGEPQLADFGIARVAGGPETSSGVITASLSYAPPEVIEGGRPSVAGDVYSLAATVFALLAGSPPHWRGGDDSVGALLHRILRDPVPDVRGRGVPDAVASVVERGLVRDPEERWPSAEAFGGGLREAQDGLGLRPTELVVYAPSTAPPPVERVAEPEVTEVDAVTDMGGPVPAKSLTEGAGSRVDEAATETVPAPGEVTDITPASEPEPVSWWRRRWGWLAAAAVVVVVVLVGSFALSGDGDEPVAASTTIPPVTTAPPATATPPATTAPATTTPATTAPVTATTGPVTTTTPPATDTSLPPVASGGEPALVWDGGEFGGFGNAVGVAIDSSDRILVTDQVEGMIRVFDRNDGYLFSFPATHPHGLALGPGGEIYALSGSGLFDPPDSPPNGEVIEKFDADGNLLRSWGCGSTSEPATCEFLEGFDIAVDQAGSVYLGHEGVMKFSADGKLDRTWNTWGDGQSFEWIGGIATGATDSGTVVYVGDFNHEMVHRFDEDGNYQTSWGDGIHPSGIAVDQSGYVYVVDQDRLVVTRFDPDGNLLESWTSDQFRVPYDVAVDRFGDIWLTDQGADALFRISRRFSLSADQACLPNETPLLVEDFQDGEAQAWSFQPIEGLEIVPDQDEPDNMMLAARVQAPWSAVYEAATYDDAVLRLRARGLNLPPDVGHPDSAFTLNWQSQVNDEMYYDFIFERTSGQFYRQDAPAGPPPFEWEVKPEEWAYIEISTFDGQVQLWIDGEQIFSFIDDQPLTNGALHIHARVADDSSVFHFDDVVVCGLNEPFQSAFGG